MARRNFDWTCDVCKKRRPDNRIGVKRHVITNARGVSVIQHVRHCNDDPSCESKATICNLTELALARVGLERDKWKAHTRRAWEYVPIFAGIGIIVGLCLGVAVRPW